MAAHLPRLPLLLFVFLAVHVPASHGDPALLPTTYDNSICSESFMCGGVNITYPFYLSNAIRETADNKSYYSCGYTGLEITCQAGEGLSATPVVRLGGDSYTVLDISYDSSTIILADSDVLLGSPRCPKPRHNVTFDHEWLRYNSSSYDNLTFFYDCYYKLGDRVPPDFDKYQINCSGFTSPLVGTASFVFTDEELGTAQEYELASHCDKNVTVPVQMKAMMGYEPYLLATGGYVDVLKMGS